MYNIKFKMRNSSHSSHAHPLLLCRSRYDSGVQGVRRARCVYIPKFPRKILTLRCSPEPRWSVDQPLAREARSRENFAEISPNRNANRYLF